MPMITIVDYGVGNIASLASMFDHIGAVTRLSSDPDVVARAPTLLLPGVGSFAHAMTVLRAKGLDEAIAVAVGNGASLLGICLGMQVLARHSEEGDSTGLGLIAADVRKIGASAEALKIPNMGWREVVSTGRSWLMPQADAAERYYFAHSYHMVCDDPEDVSATIDYGGLKTAAVAHGNIYGAQFHPEKSHRFGMRMLADFVRHTA